MLTGEEVLRSELDESGRPCVYLRSIADYTLLADNDRTGWLGRTQILHCKRCGRRSLSRTARRCQKRRGHTEERQ